MSDRSDIRMYVEHLFEGRTLDAETIELKEEIYGNLVARFDDYVAQGMGTDEAYRRTCDAVTSVEDVLGEKDGAVAAEPTAVAPAAAEGPQAEGGVPPTPAAEVPASPKRRWSTGAIVAVSVAGVLLAGVILVTVFNVLNMSDARNAYDTTTDATVQQVTDGGTTSDQVDISTNGGGNANQYGTPEQTGADLTEEVLAQSASSLAAYSGTGLGDVTRVEELVRSLPVGAYVSGVSTEVDRRALEVTYTYQDRDRVAWDDDHVDQALVYDVVALMSTIDGLDVVRIVEAEPDDGRYDTDVRIFDRTVIEGMLGTPLSSELLTEDTWNTTRDQVMSQRYWEPIWESADTD